MVGRRDYYEALGVSRSASQEEIKRAYRKLAKQYHPDRNQGDASAEARFKEIQQAYNVLRDPEKKAQYDRFGEAGVGQWSTRPGGERVYRWGGGRSAVNIDDLEDLMSAFGAGGGEGASVFEQFFSGAPRGRRGRPATAQRGADEEHPVTLTFEQAINGATISLQLRSANGRAEKIEVKIPPGVEDGQRIRVGGKGRPGPGRGPRGDLLLTCSVRPHAYLRRTGPDLHLDVPVTVAEAALGAKIDVPTLEGRATVTIPPGTPSGAKLRLKGRGVIVRGRSQPGDQYIVIKIVPPTALTEEQKKLFEKLGEEDRSDPRSRCSWWKGEAR